MGCLRTEEGVLLDSGFWSGWRDQQALCLMSVGRRVARVWDLITRAERQSFQQVWIVLSLSTGWTNKPWTYNIQNRIHDKGLQQCIYKMLFLNLINLFYFNTQVDNLLKISILLWIFSIISKIMLIIIIIIINIILGGWLLFTVWAVKWCPPAPHFSAAWASTPCAACPFLHLASLPLFQNAHYVQ